ncbi:MAG: hypothetical protein ACRCSN_01980 [Dermatophilaceae bacterium]
MPAAPGVDPRGVGPPGAAEPRAAGDGGDPDGRLAALVHRHPPVRASSAVHSCDGNPHTRLADGTMLCWPVPSASVRELGLGTSVKDVLALDAELAVTPPPRLQQRWAASDPETFWRWWTRAEVVVKLTGRAVGAILTDGPVRANAVEVTGGVVWLRTVSVDDLVVTYGWEARRRPSRRRPAATRARGDAPPR